MMAEFVPLDGLTDALGITEHEMVSFVGGGGKTTALFELGRGLTGTVVLTTTTKMGRDRTDDRPVLFGPTDIDVRTALAEHRVVLVWRSSDDHKAHGVEPESCDRWLDLADHVVVEADGARQRPCTAPGPFEPVVPSRTSLLVACVGAGAIGRVIADRCHRPMRVAALAGCSPYERLTPERLARVLLSERGLSKGRPARARYAVVVGSVTTASRPAVEALAGAIGDGARLIGVVASDRYDHDEGGTTWISERSR